jgi:histidyl-tRNA synthetase
MNDETKKTPAKGDTKDNKKEVPLSLKGMHDLLDDQYYAYQGLFEKAQEIAVYYGFKPIETPVLEREEVFLSALGEGTDVIDKEMYTFRTKGGERIAVRPEYTAAIMRAYVEHGMVNLPQPVLLYSYGPVFRHENPQKGRLRQFRQFNLEILGTTKSIADALIIRTLTTILEELISTQWETRKLVLRL